MELQNKLSGLKRTYPEENGEVIESGENTENVLCNVATRLKSQEKPLPKMNQIVEIGKGVVPPPNTPSTKD